jgi:hypothetical protein
VSVWPQSCPTDKGFSVSLNHVHGLRTPTTGLGLRPLDERRKDRAERSRSHRGRRSCDSRLQRIRTAIGLALLAALVLPPGLSSAQENRLDEYSAKATFLAAFPNFIEWPAEAFSSLQMPLLLCVFGDFSFGTSLAEKTRGASIHGRRIEVRWVHKEQDLRACHILFVSRSEASRYGKILKTVEGASVLTVGETSNFLASGGAIDFLFEEDRLQFEVSVGAATDAHLRISSNMLALARHVITRSEAAKS